MDVNPLVPSLSTAMAAYAAWSRGMAYLDRGSGSYLLQLLIAGLLGGLFALRLYWGRVKDFLRHLFNRPKAEEANDQ